MARKSAVRGRPVRVEHEADHGGPEATQVVATKPDISGLQVCIDDAREAALDGDAGPRDPTDFSDLRGRLEAARTKFPPLYRQEFVDPFIAELDERGSTGFAQILVQDPTRQRMAGLVMDMAHAVLQRAERFQLRALDAFQEIVGDLYDGFLSAEDRQGVEPPDQGTTPGLIKWGNPDSGPYTWGVDATSILGANAPVVSLPPANARMGLLAWSALPHETGGHNILHADTGLPGQLAIAVRNALGGLGAELADYWSSRIDETASDVMGILNMGPAAGIGLIGYFRGLNKAFTGRAELRNNGPANDTHPADIVRGYLAAETVALLDFSQSAAWAKIIADETDKDVQDIRLAGRRVTPQQARESARLTAEAIAITKVRSLEDHALSDIQNWRDGDEKKIAAIRQALITTADLPQDTAGPIYATHIVAAAVVEALANADDLLVIFDRMLHLLAKEHANNPVWGPLFVRHPGNLVRHVAYLPQR